MWEDSICQLMWSTKNSKIKKNNPFLKEENILIHLLHNLAAFLNNLNLSISFSSFIDSSLQPDVLLLQHLNNMVSLKKKKKIFFYN
jgi:hypothetical protein